MSVAKGLVNSHMEKAFACGVCVFEGTHYLVTWVAAQNSFSGVTQEIQGAIWVYLFEAQPNVFVGFEQQRLHDCKCRTLAQKPLLLRARCLQPKGGGSVFRGFRSVGVTSCFPLEPPKKRSPQASTSTSARTHRVLFWTVSFRWCGFKRKHKRNT